MRSLLVLRLEFCYDVNIADCEGSHSKETGQKNGFKPFPLKGLLHTTIFEKYPELLQSKNIFRIF